jgi:hypothetical protein
MIKIPAKQKMNCKMSQKIRNNSSVNQMMEYENLIDPGNEHRHDTGKESEADDKVFLKQEENTANNTETMNATPDE